MINNVQFTGNPVKYGKKGLEIAEEALASYKATRANIDESIILPMRQNRLTSAEISAARARRPVGAHGDNLATLNKSMLMNAESYRVSHGSVGLNYLA